MITLNEDFTAIEEACALLQAGSEVRAVMLMEAVAEREGLSVFLPPYDDVFVLYNKHDPAEKPFCILISPARGHSPSPSASLSVMTQRVLMQFFPEGADDGELEGSSTNPPYRLEAKGRVLFY